jgi:hypothetical protein
LEENLLHGRRLHAEGLSGWYRCEHAKSSPTQSGQEYSRNGTLFRDFIRVLWIHNGLGHCDCRHPRPATPMVVSDLRITGIPVSPSFLPRLSFNCGTPGLITLVAPRRVGLRIEPPADPGVKQQGLLGLVVDDLLRDHQMTEIRVAD